MKAKKTISIIEMLLVILSSIAFSYFVADFTTQNASASQYVPSGCCLEAKNGAICQEMPLIDSASCEDGLIGTSCETIESCQKGCCYNSDSGVCSMNSPKEKCESTGGEWNSDELCNIQECQSGCCVIGTGASLSTNRECTLLSRTFGVEKNFLALDSAGSCSAYVGLSQEGACVGASNDFSRERSCVYTTKGNCNGEFRQGYLCTSKELNTSCVKTEDTMCVDSKDQVYFTDSCGNRANIYDSTKYNDDNYWEKYIPPTESCQGQGSSCGNCQYRAGSVCTKYVSGKDLIKPTMGDYVCKDLNCANDRKHGESWCVYDFNPNSGIAPVGSRHYLATCLEGEISLSGCADFNQEICAQSTDTSYGFTEAKCLVNDWRACLNSNDADSYLEVEKKCNENPQCIMFNDLYSGGLNRSDGTIFAGFDSEKSNAEQGSIDEIGEDQNKIISHCVPRFTPGFQFWTAGTSITGSEATSSAQASSANYGGSPAETSAICSLGNFVCVSQVHRDCTLAGGCESWEDEKRNWECNANGAHTTIKGQDLPNLLAALNERCRAIGSCGVSSNYVGSTNEERSGFSVTRMKITRKGKTEKNVSVEYYDLSENYISSIKRSTPPAEKLTDITSTDGGLAAEVADSVGTSGSVSGSIIDLTTMAPGISVGESTTSTTEFMNTLGPLTSAGLSIGGWSWLATPVSTSIVSRTALTMGQVPIDATITNANWESVTYTQPNSQWLSGLKASGITIAFTIIGSYLGSLLGGLIAKNQDWSPGKAAQFNQFMGAVGGTVGYAVGYGAAAAYTGGTWAGGFSALVGYGSVWGGASVGASAAVGAGTAGGTAAGGAAAGTTAGATASGGLASGGFFAWMGPVGLIIAILYIIYEAFLNTYEEQEYYIMQFQCSGWEAPKNGDCSVCNDDVRPCSEYRCKSIGSNCHYFIENGEPGYCASLSEIWSAKITPWQEIITEGNKYTSVQSAGFKIEGANKEEVAAWKPLTFGIVVDKQTICKLDTNHSTDFDAMQYTMLSTMNYQTGKLDGMHHAITLSPHMGGSSGGDGTTPGLEQGENEYYIKCRNFAGQTNEAPFIVQVKQAEGPDLTEAQILEFNPVDESFLAMGTNSTKITMYLNEPAECKYSLEYDEIYYDSMNNSFTCMTSPNFALYGQWPCYAQLGNISSSKLEMFVKCKDQPDLEETDLIKRVVNSQSKKYSLNICENGLGVSITYPQNGNLIEINSSSSLQLRAQTSGCINSGDAACSFSVDGYGNVSSLFLETGTKAHNQLLTTLGTGNKNILVSCEDSAGNKANASVNFTIYLDDVAPKIVRVFKSEENLILQTNEDAECVYIFNNETIGCSFEINNTKGVYNTLHTLDLTDKIDGTYYFKCIDKKGNSPIGCTEVISTL